MGKLNVVYVASEKRCHEIKETVKGNKQIRVGSLPGFGEDSFFETVSAACSDKNIAGAILYIPDILETYGKSGGAGAVASFVSDSQDMDFAVAIVDPEHSFHAAGRKWLIDVGGRVADNEYELGIGFPSPTKELPDETEWSDELEDIVVAENAYDGYGDEPVNSASENILETAAPEDGGGSEEELARDLFADLLPEESKPVIPGMRAETPSDVEKESYDPFVGIAAETVADVDPFAELVGDVVVDTDGEAEEQIMELFGNPIQKKETSTLSYDDFENLVMSGGDIDAIVTEGQVDPFSAYSGEEGFGNVPSEERLKGWANKDTLKRAFEQEAIRLPRNEMGEVPLEILLEHYGYRLNDHDFKKIRSMIEPSLNYELEHDDGIGSGGLRGLRTKNGRGISQVGEDELAESAYIAERIEMDGHYFPPDECKICCVWSAKGGSGKDVPCSESILVVKKEKHRAGTDIVTESTVGELEIGDLVFTQSGKLAKVLEIHPSAGKRKIYKLTFSDGRTVRCSKDHLWPVLIHGKNGMLDHIEQKTVEEMLRKPLKEDLSDADGGYRWKVPLCFPVQFPEQKFSVEPYELGVFLGNSSPKCSVSEKTSSTIAHASMRELQNMGLKANSENMFIPQQYKFSSIKQRRALLQGLMDSTGNNSNRASGSLDAWGKQLRDDIIWLARSLGYVASTSQVNQGDEQPNNCWHITWDTGEAAIHREQQATDVLPERQKIERYSSAEEQVPLPLSPYLYGAMALLPQYPSHSVVRCYNQYVLHNIINSIPDNIVIRQVEDESQQDLYSLIARNPEYSDNPMEEALSILDELRHPASEHGLNPLYLHSAPSKRKALLQGLMDTSSSWSRGGQPAVQLPEGEMRASFSFLLDSLGYAWHEEQNDPDGSRIIVIDTDDVSIFADAEKQERMSNWLLVSGPENTREHDLQRASFMSIVGIDEIDEYENMRCLYVDDPSHLFLVGDFVPTHNTTVSVMIATQLNWYFNPEVMQRLTTSIHNRILIISLNEFDDLPTHGIGYDEYFSEEYEIDSRNAVELLDCIDVANGHPMWGDISHCFVATDSNRIFYLPSLTQREELGDGVPNIVTAENYKKIIDVCSQFFSFIILDTPDTFYHDRDDLVTFGFSIADVICFVIEADLRNTSHLYHFIDALKDEDGNTPLDEEKCLLVVNKYVSSGNPYMPIPPIGQIKYSDITKKLSGYFSRFIMIPYSQPRAFGNVLNGTDSKVKFAAGDLADAILEMIDQNDAKVHSVEHHDVDLW